MGDSAVLQVFSKLGCAKLTVDNWDVWEPSVRAVLRSAKLLYLWMRVAKRDKVLTLLWRKIET